ncbi:MAG: hypothetical protein K9J21_11770 [Bacteroidales bacterium]|nr:hypothetical protein [Bacteroidales bacterium]
MSAIEILEEKLQQADETFKVSFSRENYVEKEDEGWKILHILPENWEEPFYKTNLQVVSTLGFVTPDEQPLVFPIIFESDEESKKFTEGRIYNLDEEIIQTGIPNYGDILRKEENLACAVGPTVSVTIDQIDENKWKITGKGDISFGIFQLDLIKIEITIEIEIS